MSNKNEEILDELEGNHKKFRVLKLLDTTVYAKDKYDAIKKAKSKQRKQEQSTESRIIEEKSKDFKNNYTIASAYFWVKHKNECKEIK